MSPWWSEPGTSRPLRRGCGPTALLVVLWGVLAATAPVHGQDRTARWLSDRGMDELLALHLEEQLVESTGDADARRRVASRLAEVYAGILRAEEDAERRDALVTQSRRLLDIVPSDEAASLRIALARNRYLNASRTLEDDRIELSTPEDVAEAVAELDGLAEELATIRRSISRQVESLSRSRSRRVERRLEELVQWQAMSALLEGWSRYYVGRARGDRTRLEQAQLAFGVVLEGDNPVPAPSEVSVDLQAVEGFARAVLGMGMTSAILETPSITKQWFERLQYPVTDPGTRRLAPGWRLAALIDAADWPAVLASLADLEDRASREGDELLPTSWLRLAAVGGLRKANEGGGARDVAATALAALAGRGELAQVQDLATRFGTTSFGGDGFIFRYVRGVEAYRVALEARDAGDDVAARAAFAEAVEELRAAADEPEADRFAAARAGCLALVGWSLLELGEPAEAADAFEFAAERSNGDRRADALWGAIVALDRIVESGGPDADDARARRDSLSTRFVDAFPADDRAPSLLVRQIVVQENPGEDDLEVLLGVPPSHPTWELARRRATQALYRQFRGARTGERGAPGRRMLEVVDELLDRPDRDAGIFTDLRGLDGVLLRQGAEVASDIDVHDTERAARYLAQIELASERGGFDDLPDILNEVEYRRIGLALGGGDFEEAANRMLAMPVTDDTPEADRWTRLAAQRVHRAAALRMRDGRVGVDVARAAVESGRRYLELLSVAEDGTTPEDRFAILDRDRMLPIAASIASALDALQQATGDPVDGREALEWYRAILDRRPNDGSVLEAAGELASRLDEPEFALECWRTLVRGAPDGSDLWWKARTRQVAALLQVDPVRAAEVLEQVRALHPELGPEPWREALRALDVEISVTLARDAEDATSSDEGTEGGG